MSGGVDLFGDKAGPVARRRRSALHGEANYARIERDAYFTPAWVTETLLGLYPIQGPIWEPACGDGRIAEVLRAEDHVVIASDIHDYSYECVVGHDFLRDPPLTTPRGNGPAAIVTNPPYGTEGASALAFVMRALELMRPAGGQVAMLLAHSWDCAGGRVSLFRDREWHFAAKITLTKRIVWFGGRKKSEPRLHHAWFVWDFAHDGPPIMEWGP